MHNFFKWFFRLLTLIAVLAVGGIIFGYMMISKSIPDYDASFTTEKSGYDVEILRDHNAVPHIYGADFNQVMFGLGVAHAQDRLWQMSMLRRVSQGRISEIAGEDTLELDLFLRALDLWNIAGKNLNVIDAKTKAQLQAYADGVNSYAQNIIDEGRGRGAPEFYLTGTKFEEWTPQDSVAVLKLMALQLSSSAENEVLRTKLSAVLSPEEYTQYFYDAEAPVTLFQPQVSFNDRDVPDIVKALSPTGYGQEAGASNAFVAAPARSTTDTALLASDPHLSLNAPAIWHLAHLETENGTWVGSAIPGIPTILIGHSDKLAWGLTTANLDDQDLVIVKLDQFGETYETANGDVALESYQTQIQVKGEKEPRAFVMYKTEYGPLIPKVGPWGLEEILPSGHEAALSWTALTDNDTTIMALMGMMQAPNVAAADAVLGYAIAPAQMVTLADVDGNIAQIAVGRMPKRSLENKSKGEIPAISWGASPGFKEYFPYEANPRTINPESGLLMHTNNKFMEGEYPAHYSFNYGDNYRIRRAQSLLGKRKIQSPEGFEQAQSDKVSMDARIILPLIASELWFKPGAEGRQADALDLLGNWNGSFDALSPEPLIYSTWIAELQTLIFSDELGPVSDEITKTDPYRLELVFRDIKGARAWCNVKQTPEDETCAQLSELALDQALDKLTETYGANMTTWRWGHAHQALHENETLGGLPFIGALANIVQEVDGGAETLLRASYKSDDMFDFTAVHGASVRMVMNFAEADNSKFITSTGQSGNILSVHYSDLNELWSTGKYIQIPTERRVVEGNAETEMTVKSAN